MKLRDLERLPDRELLAELRLAYNGLHGDEADYDLDPSDTAAWSSELDLLDTSLDVLDVKRADAATARGDRDNKRTAATTRGRDLLKKARLAAGNDGEKLGQINLDQYDTTLTTPDAPTSTPFALIDFGILRHTINFRDSSTPDKRAKPDGMLGCEIWSKVGGDAPAADSDFSMVALDTSSPHIVNYSLSDEGKPVWYRMRWVTKSGDKGGWGEVAKATING